MITIYNGSLIDEVDVWDVNYAIERTVCLDSSDVDLLTDTRLDNKIRYHYIEIYFIVTAAS